MKAYLSYALLRASVSKSATIFQASSYLILAHSNFSLSSSNDRYLFPYSMQLEYLQYFCCDLGKALRQVNYYCSTLDMFSCNVLNLSFCAKIIMFIYLQIEIGIFFPLIVLRSLDSSECSLNLKLMVIGYNFCLLYSPQLSYLKTIHRNLKYGTIKLI